jgi:hypothetical protein
MPSAAPFAMSHSSPERLANLNQKNRIPAPRRLAMGAALAAPMGTVREG